MTAPLSQRLPRGLFPFLGFLLVAAFVHSAGAQATWRSIADSRPHNAVWMANASEGWAVGTSGALSRTTDGGETWTAEANLGTQSLNGIYGISTNDIWAVGSGGVIRHWNGTTWSTQNSGTTENLNAIHGNGTLVFAVGDAGTVLRRNGATWTSESLPNNVNQNLNGIWVAGNGTAFTVGAAGRTVRYNGTTWSNQPSGVGNGVNLLAVHGSAANSLWAVGDGGAILFWDGSSWGTQTSGVTVDLRSVFALNATQVLAGGANGTLRAFNGSAWSAQNANTNQTINALHFQSASQALAVGNRRMTSLWDGSTWESSQAQLPNAVYTAIWALDDDRVWFGGAGGNITRWDGSTFTTTATPTNRAINGLWGSDYQNIWAVGAAGTILKWDGTTWTAQASDTTESLNGVAGTSASQVWAVGANGTIRRWNGTAWTTQASGTTRNLNAVWANPSGVAYAVGQGGIILKYSGGQWSPQVSGTNRQLFAVWGHGNTAFAAGANGTILKLTGATWSTMTSGVTTAITGISGTAADKVWASTGTGFLFSDGTQWSNDSSSGFGLPVVGLLALAPNALFASTNSGILLTSSPATVPEITLTQLPSLILDHLVSTSSFGPCLINQPVPLNYRIQNTGTAPLTGIGLQITGSRASEYIATALAGDTLPVGQFFDFTLTFTPLGTGTRPATLQITSNDLTEPTLTIPLDGSGFVPVAITKQSTDRAVNPKTKVTFSVTATGTSPISYQWQKDGIDIANATKSSYILSSAAESQEGVYRVIVSNPASTLPSAPILFTVNDPIVITTQPVATASSTGVPVVFTAAATGTEPIIYQWQRNGRNLLGATSSVLTLTNPTVADGGTYTVVVSNVTGQKTSEKAPLTIANASTRILALPSGATATITPQYFGTVTGFTWDQNGGALPDSPRFTGWTGKTLKITGLTTDDSANYGCLLALPVPFPTLPTTTQLIVYTDPPELELPELPAEPIITFDDAIVGGSYSDMIPFNPSALRTPIAFTVSGLPKGLKVNAATGEISGVPQVALTASREYRLTIRASNKKGSSSAPGRLTLHPLPVNADGTYVGRIERHLDINANLGGRLDLKIATTSALSGKLALGASTFSFKGQLNAVLNAPNPTANIEIKRRNLPSIFITFTLDTANHTIGNDLTITIGSESSSGIGWRNRWPTLASMDPLEAADFTARLGPYSVAMLPPAPPVDPQDALNQPQGAAYTTFSISANGTARLTGHAPDGSAFTCATFCGGNGDLLLHCLLNSKKGSLSGHLITDPGSASAAPPHGDTTTLSNLTWTRPPGTSRLYPAGVNALALEAVGGRYVVPANGILAMGLTDDGTNPNAVLNFTHGDVTDTATSPDINLRIHTRTSVALPSSNPRSTKLSLTPTTGRISGSFKLLDSNPATPGTNFTRTSTFRGAIVRDSANSITRGYGYFQLAKRPAASSSEKTSTTRLLSGLVSLSPLP